MDSSSPQALAETRKLAAEHGEQRLELGYDVAAVVRDYAALPDALQGLLRDRGFHPRADEVLQLTRFLVEGIATAAHAYSLEHDAKIRTAAAQHAGFLVHDLRQPLQSLKLRADLMERRREARVCRRSAGRSGRLCKLSAGRSTARWCKAGSTRFPPRTSAASR